jgi:hypothetical protein
MDSLAWRPPKSPVMPWTRILVWGVTRMAMMLAESVVQILWIARAMHHGDDTNLFFENLIVDGVGPTRDIDLAEALPAERPPRARMKRRPTPLCFCSYHAWVSSMSRWASGVMTS